MLLCQALGDLLGGDCAEQAAALSGLGSHLHGQPLQLFRQGLGLRLLGSLLGLAGLLLLLHGVHILGRGDNSQLLGKQEIPGVAVRDIDQLALLPLALDVLL